MDDRNPFFSFAWRWPRVIVVRGADRHWFVPNRLCGILIGVAVGLPKLSRRPGYPLLSLLWGRAEYHRG